MQVIDKLMEEKLVAVIRADNKEIGYKLVKAIIRGGIKAIEITYTVPEADTLIARLDKEFGEDILLGAGTVLNLTMCKKAIKHGAKYIVSPGFDIETAKYCNDNNIPYLPGCMTVTEMMTALNHNVKVVKLFPGSHFGPKFIKTVKAPLPDIKVMVTGGVNLDNITDWLAHGADVIGIGSGLTKHYEKGNYDTVTEAAKQYKKQIKDVL